jgi:hypothetical protein
MVGAARAQKNRLLSKPVLSLPKRTCGRACAREDNTPVLALVKSLAMDGLLATLWKRKPFS